MIRTSTKGIFQSDIIIRTALIEGLERLRANPWELDFIFASLLHDDLTRSQYGEKELEEAKEWFLKTDIPVGLSFRIDQPVTPFISLSLEDANEGATTLGDVHYDPSEEVDVKEIIVKPRVALESFTPESYNSKTGTITLPARLNTNEVFAGMMIYDTNTNNGYPIINVLDEKSFTIAPGTIANFTKTIVAPADNFYIASLRSIQERESCRIDLYVSGSSLHLLYLHAIVKYCLLKHKQDLFEARGFEGSTFSTTGVRLFPNNTSAEIIFTRAFLLSGFVRQYWVHDLKPKIWGIGTDIRIKDASATPEMFKSEVQAQGWSSENDNFDGLG